MCARRFLSLILILTLIAVGGAFALYQWGGTILLRQATPTGHYQEPPRGSGPDYAKAESWVARPDIKENPADWRPEGAAADPKGERRSATFFIHPTTYLERDRWNAPLNPSPQIAGRTRLFVQSQASAFAPAGDVWAPKYRQAAYGAFLLTTPDAEKALDLAYRDVLAAFDAFLAAQPKSMPIILAGHSQGSLHLLRLLKDRRGVLKDRVTAAYVLGWPVSVTADLPSTGLPACAYGGQIRCVISWQSFGAPPNPSLVTNAWVGTTGLTGRKRLQADMLCTNPFTGTRDGSGTMSTWNGGALVPNKGFGSAKLEQRALIARCDHGFLVVTGDIPDLGSYALPGNNYHVYDYALFWNAIRQDALNRSYATGPIP